MKIRTKYIVFIAILHTVALVMSFFIFRDHKILFLCSELGILLSLALSWSLYNDFIRPIQFLAGGAEAIHDRDFNVKMIKTGAYEMDQLVEVYNQMIDQLRLERTLQQEQHFFLEKLIQTAPVGTLMLDYDGYIADANPKMLQLLGLSQKSLSGKHTDALDHPLLDAVGRLQSGDSAVIQMPNAQKFKVQKATFVDRGFHRAFVMVEELTLEILEAEKKAYGKVIRMMAHEVNNSIGAVNSILDTVLQLETNPMPANALKVAIERNEHLNQFMRRFADVIRLPEPRREMIDLCELVRKTATLMQFKTAGKDIRFEFDFALAPFPISVDVQQIEQALINIVKNAIEAIEQEGCIRFGTTANPNELSITDNGKGIPKALAPQLFSPFFSSKTGGQGIGLTLVRDILLGHGFSFSLQTEGEGVTVFRIGF